MNYTSFTFADIFAGIGGARLGFEQAGGFCVFSCETEPEARAVYEDNFGEIPAGDARCLDLENLPDFDVLVADFPHSLSQVWGEDGLFSAVEAILEKKRPAAFLLENGKNVFSHRGGQTLAEMKGRLEALGYTVYTKVLNAWDYGVPQKRERLVTVGFSEPILFAFPEAVPERQRKGLADILEPEGTIKRSYYVSSEVRERKMEKMLERFKREPERPYVTNENVSGMVTPHRYACSLRAGASANYLLVNNERRMTERELFRLQGFPDTYRMPSSFVEVKNLTGNSSAVPMVRAVAERMMAAVELYHGGTVGLERGRAKAALDRFLRRKGQEAWRVIQAAEILHEKRLHPELSLERLETYKKESRQWRDAMAKRILGEGYQPPAAGQDSLFYKTALPPEILRVLGEENCRTGGAVEAYVYRRLFRKDRRLEELLSPWLSGEETADPAALLAGLGEPGMEDEARALRECMAQALWFTLEEVLAGKGGQRSLEPEGGEESRREAETESLRRAVALLTGAPQGDEGFFTAGVLTQWYERMISGPCRETMAGPALRQLRLALKERFGARRKPWEALAGRGYEILRDGFWK